MQDRPNAGEILATVGAFIDDLVVRLHGPDQYRARVAANLVHIVERETRLGTRALLDERAVLCDLLSMQVDDLAPGPLAEQIADLNQQLVSDIETASSVAPAREQAIRAVLLRIARDKLAIAKPGYADYDGTVEAR